MTDLSAPSHVAIEPPDADRLAEFIADNLPESLEVEVSELRRTTAGFSRENWTFEATWRVGSEMQRAALIMRRDPPGSVLETDRAVEFALLQALEHSSVPVPLARWLDSDGVWFGRPMIVMDRIEGACELLAMNGERPLGERHDFGRRCVELLARIHAVDWVNLDLEPVVGPAEGAGARAEISRWEAELRRQQLQAYPELEVVLAWLRSHAPDPQAIVLVHGDFKPGNMLLNGLEIVAMLDWETGHLGDPLEDLGWITNPLRHREHQIAGTWERNDIVSAYEELSGFSVDHDELHFWNVLANFKLCVIVLTGMRSYIEERGDRFFGNPGALISLLFDEIGLA